jgi:hypothetical protein
MPPTPEMHDACAHFVRAELLQRDRDRLDRALHVALDDQRELLACRTSELRHHLLERAALAGAAGGHRLVAGQTLAVLGDLASPGFVLDGREAVARPRRALKTEHLDRGRRAGFLDLLAAIVDQRAHAAPLGRRRR